MITLVRSVIARSAESGSRLNVRGSTSAKTGGAPHRLPPLDEAGEALLDVDPGLEAELLTGQLGAGQTARDAVDRAGRAVLDAEVGAHHAQQHLGELEQARLCPAGDVVDDVGLV